MKQEHLVLLGGEVATQSLEEIAVQNVLEIYPGELEGQDLEEYHALVSIVSQFSRVNPDTGVREIISPSRLGAIQAITERHCRLQYPSRGVLNKEQIIQSWRSNMPENRGTRHPDSLFDDAQWNFGTDTNIFDIERSVMRAELDRRQLSEYYQSMARTALRYMQWEQPLDGDIDFEQIEETADCMMKNHLDRY